MFKNLPNSYTQFTCKKPSLKTFLFKVNRQDPEKSFLAKKKGLKRIGAECTPGCQKKSIFIKFEQETSLSSLGSSTIIFRYQYFTYTNSGPATYFNFQLS